MKHYFVLWTVKEIENLVKSFDSIDCFQEKRVVFSPLQGVKEVSRHEVKKLEMKREGICEQNESMSRFA